MFIKSFTVNEVQLVSELELLVLLAAPAAALVAVAVLGGHALPLVALLGRVLRHHVAQ